MAITDTSILPDLALRLATIERAICDATGNIQKVTNKQKIQQEALEWIFSDSTDLFSFIECTQAINASPVRIRRIVLECVRDKVKLTNISRHKIGAIKYACRLDDAGLLINYTEGRV